MLHRFALLLLAAFYFFSLSLLHPLSLAAYFLLFVHEPLESLVEFMLGSFDELSQTAFHLLHPP